MTTDPDLLPPNATPLERALSKAMARLGEVPAPMRDLWNPQECPAHLLPWLAWGLSIDRWRADWSEYRKRNEVARAIQMQRVKGTPASLEELLEDYDRLIRFEEWFELEPPGIPHTFRVIIPIDGTPAARNTAEFAHELVRDIYRTKPARSHFELWLELATEALLVLMAAGYAMIFRRLPMATDTGLARALRGEDGRLLLAEDGDLLEVG